MVSCGSAVYHAMRVVPSLKDALADVTGGARGICCRLSCPAACGMCFARQQAVLAALKRTCRHPGDTSVPYVTGSVGFTRRAGAGRVTYPSLSSLLAHFPATLPAPMAAEERPSQENDSQPLEAGGSSSSGSSQQQDAQRQGGGERLALVFGREESGLLEAELLLCSHACAIPTGRPALDSKDRNSCWFTGVALA